MYAVETYYFIKLGGNNYCIFSTEWLRDQIYTSQSKPLSRSYYIWCITVCS